MSTGQNMPGPPSWTSFRGYAPAKRAAATGPVFWLAPKEFLALVSRNEDAFVVMTRKTDWIFWYRYHYLTLYNGIIFVTEADKKLELPTDTEVITAKKLWLPPFNA